ncbi:cytochrome b/b6 domain-containing protein [Candidatus Pelagibacter sp.]|nr:cytochrome b/b6 domain-containing protein [Candidatus Pelagibacter sp.]
MSLNNTITEYGLVAKLFHWISFIILIIQIPLGFYLVKLDFSDTRITLEEYHVIFGIIIFYLTILRLFYKIISKSPKLHNSSFIGQNLIAKLNHFALYLSLLSITTSGILKKVI